MFAVSCDNYGRMYRNHFYRQLLETWEVGFLYRNQNVPSNYSIHSPRLYGGSCLMGNNSKNWGFHFQLKYLIYREVFPINYFQRGSFRTYRVPSS